MICQDIMNIIANYVIMERNKDKFDNVIKQLKQVKHDYDQTFEEQTHTIIIKKKNYNVEFTYMPNYCGKTISRSNKYYSSYGDFVDNHPHAYQWEESDGLWNLCGYARNDGDINHIKEMEQEVIDYFNSLKPLKRNMKFNQ